MSTSSTGESITPSFPNGCVVSTVWLGVDHGFGRTDRPVIFETMARANGGASWDEDSLERYTTLAEAEAGHKQTVALWLNGPPASAGGET